jgi:hypothetical protein
MSLMPVPCRASLANLMSLDVAFLRPDLSITIPRLLYYSFARADGQPGIVHSVKYVVKANELRSVMA